MTDLMQSDEACKHLSRCPRSEPALADRECTCGVGNSRTEAEARVTMLRVPERFNGMAKL